MDSQQEEACKSINKEPYDSVERDVELYNTICNLLASLRQSSLRAHIVDHLHRTTSYKYLPHLFLGRALSTPMNASPRHTDRNNIHGCHSHCALPHLPGYKRKSSLPLNVTASNIREDGARNAKERRQSFPIVRSKLRRCRALHQTNVTFDSITKNMNGNYQNLQNIKSDTELTRNELKESKICSGKQSSCNLLSETASILPMHYIDSSFLRYHEHHHLLDPQSLTQIKEQTIL